MSIKINGVTYVPVDEERTPMFKQKTKRSLQNELTEDKLEYIMKENNCNGEIRVLADGNFIAIVDGGMAAQRLEKVLREENYPYVEIVLEYNTW